MSTKLVNNTKTALLLGGLMGLCIVVGAQWGEGGLVLGFLLGGAMNLFGWFFSDKIAIRAMRGRELTRANGGSLYTMTETLAERAGLPMPKLYICPHQAPNAFATGRSPKKAAVAVTQGLVDLCTPAELEGVIAHELAHIKNRDTLISTVAAMVAGTLAFLAQWGLMFSMLGRQHGNPAAILVVILAAVGAAVLKAMVSRSREFVADADGAAIAGSPDGLMSALAKLDQLSRRVPLDQPNPAQNNLFIVEPLASAARGGNTVNRLFASHPPTEARLSKLAELRGR